MLGDEEMSGHACPGSQVMVVPGELLLSGQ